MRFKSRNAILFLGILLVIFSFFLSFFWQPDNLIKFVPKNSFLYLHLDLNQARRTGCLGNQWLNDFKIQQILADLPEDDVRLALVKNTFKRENTGLIDEIALVLFPQEQNYENDKSSLSETEVIILLKLKRWTNPSLLIKSLKNFHVQELTTHVWAISPQIYPSKFQYSGFSPDQRIKKDSLFSKLSTSFWAKGYINFNNLQEDIKKENEISQTEKDLLEIGFYSISNPENLFFSINLPKQDDNKNLFSFDDSILNDNSNQSFVLIFSQVESIDFLTQKIKQALAVQKPIKKQVLLLDQTSFTELIVDLNEFNFETKEFNQTTVRYWPFDFFENQEQLGFIVWQDQEQNFISNRVSLFEEIVNAPNKIFSGFQMSEIEKGIFFQSLARSPTAEGEKLPLRDTLILQTEQGIKGRITLEF